MNTQLTSHFLALPQGQLHYKSAGHPSKDTIVFLHGFPEFWYSWKKQMTHFSNQFHVVAPDLRGYNKSLKPKRVKDYKIDLIANDVLELINHLKKEQVILVGHDWGAAIAWHLALLYEKRFSKVIILNVPHPFILRKKLVTNLKQLSKSWYMFFFQLPVLPHLLLSANNFKRAAKMLLASSNKGSFTETDIAAYKAAWSNENALKYMIMWYKAMMRYPAQAKAYKDKKVNIPLKIIWGKNDIALVPEMAKESLEYCKQGDLTYLENATHWVNNDCPEEVNQLIETFILKQH